MTRKLVEIEGAISSMNYGTILVFGVYFLNLVTEMYEISLHWVI